MLRISKFKFWNFIVGRMSQVYTLQQLHEEEVNFNNLRELQFTGLKDSHRVEIFEGDVLELPNGTKGVVEWLECGFVLKMEKETVWQNLLFNVISHYLIIGNIYENPELLKK